MISIKEIFVKKILKIKANAGCPAMTGEGVRGRKVGNAIICEGNGSKACSRCEIRNTAATS